MNPFPFGLTPRLRGFFFLPERERPEWSTNAAEIISEVRVSFLTAKF